MSTFFVGVRQWCVLFCVFSWSAVGFAQNNLTNTTIGCVNGTALVPPDANADKAKYIATQVISFTCTVLGIGIGSTQVWHVYKVKDVRALPWTSLLQSELVIALSLSYWALNPIPIFLWGAAANLGLQSILLYFKFRYGKAMVVSSPGGQATELVGATP